MLRFILGRVLSVIPVMLIVLFVVFMIVHIGPGDPAGLMAGPNANAEQIEAIRQKLNLDKPLMEQFRIYFSDVTVADFALAPDAQGVFQGVMGLALVQSDLGPALHVSVEEPFDDEEGPLDAADFAERDGQLVLAWIRRACPERQTRLPISNPQTLVMIEGPKGGRSLGQLGFNRCC